MKRGNSRNLIYRLGERLFYKEGDEISLVEVLNDCYKNEDNLKLRVLRYCNSYRFNGVEGSEFYFFKNSTQHPLGFLFKNYPDNSCCSGLQNHLKSFKLKYPGII